MKWVAILSTIVFVSVTFTASGQSATTKPSHPFGYPLVPDLVADPSIAEFDGTFYLFSTTDGAGAGLSSAGMPVAWKSRDFVNWSFEGSIFPAGFDAKFWAPSEPVRKAGVYHLFPTLDNRITRVVSQSPLGPYVQPDGRPVTRAAGWKPWELPVGNPIDAQTFVDDDGSVYMVWSQRGIAKLTPDLSAIEGNAITIKTKRGGYSEGPFLFKRKGIYYYLYTLDGHENYRYAYMMSRTSPMGPWEAPEKDLIGLSDRAAGVHGPGHGCFFSPAGTDDWYFVYLEYGRGGTNRQIYADRMVFNADGTIQPVKVTMQGVGPLRGAQGGAVNLAASAVVSASSVRPPLRIEPRAYRELDRTETFDPALAVDGSNGSRWMPADGDATPSLTVDFGKPTRVSRTELYFVMPTGGHAYKLECSDDGKSWRQIGGQIAPTARSPHVDMHSVLTRYLRVTITGGTAGVWEFRAY